MEVESHGILSLHVPGIIIAHRLDGLFGTRASFQLFQRTDTCFALAKDLRNRPKNKADMRVSCHSDKSSSVIATTREVGTKRMQIPSAQRSPFCSFRNQRLQEMLGSQGILSCFCGNGPGFKSQR